MYSSAILTLAAAAGLPLAAAAEQVLGVYIFHRHGDRTAKAWKPVNFTALGADEVLSSAAFYRDRYVSSKNDLQIKSISSNIANPAQIAVTAPVDNVLYDSATTFLQGLYPPTGLKERLRNGTEVQGPLGGYQYIPVSANQNAASSSGSESSPWLQGGSNCSNAVISSNNYFDSKEYKQTYDDSLDFYHSLLPVINSTFPEADASFLNAYTIFDLINVANIHNSSIPSDNLINNSSFSRLYNLANTHEWNLAYNSSDRVRAVAGSVLASQILDALSPIAQGKAKSPTMNVQFGAYGTFMSFFGLADLPAASNDFYGICDYASSMTFELVTNKTSGSHTSEDVSVRFYFANGTTAQNPLSIFPLFGQKSTTLSWSDFEDGMNKFAIQDDKQWCQLCGNTDGTCANNNTSGDDASSSSSGHGGDNGVSKPVAGVIGALVTLVVILGAQALIMLAGGLRLVKKSTLTQGVSSGSGNGHVKA